MGLRVCQLCSVDFTLQKFLLPLVDSLTSCGYEVTSVCSDGDQIDNIRSLGYSVETVPISRSLNPFRALSSFIHLVRLFQHHKFHVVHVHTPVAAFIGRLAAKFCRVPCVIYTAHGFYFHENMPFYKFFLFYLIERIGFLFTDILFCQSQEDSDFALRHHFLSPQFIHTIGNGVDPNRFFPPTSSVISSNKSRFSMPSDSFVVGFIGRQVREKGICELLDAVIQLSPQYPNLYLCLVGSRLPSDHSSGVTQEIDSAKRILGSRLITVGYYSDIPTVLSTFDVFCLPSWREGMPRSIIEAMMLSKPVVATDIRGSREEVVHNETGFIVPLNSSQQLANSIEIMINDSDLCKAFGDAGRQRALKLYDEAHIVQTQLTIISNYLSSLSL